MLSYKDRTFCKSDCTNTDCSRYVFEAVEKAAAQVGLPIAYADFSDTCKDYTLDPAA